jgi:hypothetical protein
LWLAQAELKTVQPSESKLSHVFTDLRRFEIPTKQNDRSQGKMVTESSKFPRDILGSAKHKPADFVSIEAELIASDGNQIGVITR